MDFDPWPRCRFTGLKTTANPKSIVFISVLMVGVKPEDVATQIYLQMLQKSSNVVASTLHFLIEQKGMKADEIDYRGPMYGVWNQLRGFSCTHVFTVVVSQCK